MYSRREEMLTYRHINLPCWYAGPSLFIKIAVSKKNIE